MSSSACLCSARASLLPRSRAATPSISLQIRWISARAFSFFLGDEGFKRKRNQKQRSWLKKPNEITKKSCFQFPTYLPPFPTISPALSGPLCFRDTSQHHAPLPTVASSLLVLPADLQWESAIVSLLPVASAPGRVDSWYSWRSINHGDGMTNDQQPLIGDWDYSRWVLFYSPCISCIDVLGDFNVWCLNMFDMFLPGHGLTCSQCLAILISSASRSIFKTCWRSGLLAPNSAAKRNVASLKAQR